jgi:hypothetical protein
MIYSTISKCSKTEKGAKISRTEGFFDPDFKVRNI